MSDMLRLYRHIVAVMVVSVVLLSNCWAQLAQSPWPVFQGNIQASGYTPIVATPYKTAWSITMGGGRAGDSAVIGRDGVLYAVNMYGLSAINPNGTVRWRHTSIDGSKAPAVGADGMVYYGTLGWLDKPGAFYAVRPDGTRAWSFDLPGMFRTSTPMIDNSNNVYFSTSGSNGGWLYSFRGDTGQMNWSRQIVANGGGGGALAMDANGNIVVGGRESGFGYLAAYNPAGTQLWKVGAEATDYGSPAIGPDGTIYIGGLYGELAAITPNGQWKWFRSTETIYSTPAVAPNGNVYVKTYGGFIRAYSPAGDLLWKFQPSGVGPESWGTLTIDGTGTIYCTSTGLDNKSYLIAVNPDGTEKYRVQTGIWMEGSAVVAADGSVYVTGGAAITRLVPEPSAIFTLFSGLGAIALGCKYKRRNDKGSRTSNKEP